MPAGPWLLRCGKRQGKRNTSREFNFSPLLATVGSENVGSAVCENEKTLPIQVVMLACCLATGNFLGADVCVFSPGAATNRSFPQQQLPTQAGLQGFFSGSVHSNLGPVKRLPMFSFSPQSFFCTLLADVENLS